MPMPANTQKRMNATTKAPRAASMMMFLIVPIIFSFFDCSSFSNVDAKLRPCCSKSRYRFKLFSGVHLLPLFTPSSPLVKTSSRVGKPPDGASCSPCHPQVLHPLLTFRGGASAGFPRLSSSLRGERQRPVSWSAAGCAGFTPQGS